jgi:hypothetical protein
MTVHPWADGPNPWRDWLELPEFELHHRVLPDGVHGLTDGVKNVWHDVRLLQVERRYTTRHEREHVDAGHTGCMEGRAEARILYRAAQYLCPKPRPIIDALVAAEGDIGVAADHLWLPERALRARLDDRFTHRAELPFIIAEVNKQLDP